MVEVWIQGKRTPVTLSDSNFVAEGGEGRIYAKGSTVYKIYLDQNKMPPPAKIKFLQNLRHPCIVSPQDLLVNHKGQAIGYTMKKVNGYPLARFFTSDFQQKMNYKQDAMVQLYNKLCEGFSYLHSKSVLVVDANENNFLVDSNDLVTPYFIDVCGYSIPGYPATALANNVRDYSRTDFSEKTDWFSFAVLVCQLFTGIHPYKGRHPDFKKNDIEGRMKNHVSIFNKETRVPASVRDFSIIPSDIFDWLYAVLEKGERLSAPHSNGAKKASIKQPQKKGNNEQQGLMIRLVQRFDSVINDVVVVEGNKVVKLDNGSYVINDIKYSKVKGGKVLVTPVTATPYVAYKKEQTLVLYDPRLDKENVVAAKTDDYYTVGSYIVAKAHNNLQIFALKELGKQVVTGLLKQKDILPYATTVMDGFVYTNVLGKPYVIVFDDNTEALYEKSIPELEGYKLVNSKYRANVLAVVAEKNNRYDLFVLKFTTNFTNYEVAFKEENIDVLDINFVVLDNGIVVMSRNDVLYVYHNSLEQTGVKEVKVPDTVASKKLVTNGSSVYYLDGKDLYNIRMK